MTPENEKSESALIGKAFETVSKEISYEDLARALLHVALPAVRDAMHISPLQL